MLLLNAIHLRSKIPSPLHTDRNTDGISCAARIFLCRFHRNAALRAALQKVSLPRNDVKWRVCSLGAMPHWRAPSVSSWRRDLRHWQKKSCMGWAQDQLSLCRPKTQRLTIACRPPNSGLPPRRSTQPSAPSNAAWGSPINVLRLQTNRGKRTSNDSRGTDGADLIGAKRRQHSS